MSGNSALRPQIGSGSIQSVINTHNTDLTGGSGQNKVSHIDTGSWMGYASGLVATMTGSAAGAGYILGKFEFSQGTKTDVRIPLFTTEAPG